MTNSGSLGPANISIVTYAPARGIVLLKENAKEKDLKDGCFCIGGGSASIAG